MLRTIVMMELPIEDIANMERWYYREHSSEISRRYGPWLEWQESFIALEAPADAQKYGFYNRNLLPGIYNELGGQFVV